jgi:hypothetical protein
MICSGGWRCETRCRGRPHVPTAAPPTTSRRHATGPSTTSVCSMPRSTPLAHGPLAHGLLAALELMRAAEAQHTPLRFEILRRWQQHVLGIRMPPFRVHPAFAKGGRERYGIGPDTQDQFDACLAQSAFDPDHTLSVSVRAARDLSRRVLLPPLRRRQCPVSLPGGAVRPRARGNRAGKHGGTAQVEHLRR